MVHCLTLVRQRAARLQKIYNRAPHTADEAGRVSGSSTAPHDIANALLRIGTPHGGPCASSAHRLQHRVFDALVYGRIRAAMGSARVRHLRRRPPRGAPRTRFFDGVGMSVLRGLGTDGDQPRRRPSTCRRRSRRPGTVGAPMPGTTSGSPTTARSSRTATSSSRATGTTRPPPVEVLRGRLVPHRRHRRAGRRRLPAHHRQEEGPDRDRGRQERRTGARSRTGCARTGSSANCLVVGDARPYVGVLVTLDEEAVVQWAQDRGAPEPRSVADVLADPALQAEVQAGGRPANAAVSKAESIRRLPGVDA